MAISFVLAGALATNATTVTLGITGPACNVDDILLAFIYGNNNQVVTAPDGTWTSINALNNTANMRSSIFWKRATASGGTFNFTKPVDDNLLFAGVIGAWRGCVTAATPIDATAPSTSANAASTDVTFATFDPTETTAFVLAAAFVLDDLTIGGAVSGTDPTFTKRIDVETSIGNDCSIFVSDGTSSGAATGSRTQATGGASVVNSGIQFGLVTAVVTAALKDSISRGVVPWAR